MRVLVIAVASLWTLTLAVPVLACGGLFCGAPPPQPAPPEPVDQNAERIIFEVDDGEIRTHVQIQYFGQADDFAWVVPVPNVPSVVTESDPALFEALDAATRLQVLLPTPEPCAFQNGGGGGGSSGCVGCSDDDAATLAGASAPRSADSPVTVYAQDYTDNFEFAVLGAEVSQDLVDWLVERDFNVSDNMTPVMDVYNQGETVFVALKLRAEREASDIVPILLTYDGDAPAIPIQLTAVAAQPLMGILVFVVADQPFEPENYGFQTPNTADIVHDRDGVTSYFEWVARETTEQDGQFFSIEYVGVNPLESRSFANDIRLSGSRVSRYYTRMSPESMTVDPRFTAANNQSLTVAPVLDLSANTTLYQCATVAR